MLCVQLQALLKWKYSRMKNKVLRDFFFLFSYPKNDIGPRWSVCRHVLKTSRYREWMDYWGSELGADTGAQTDPIKWLQSQSNLGMKAATKLVIYGPNWASGSIWQEKKTKSSKNNNKGMCRVRQQIGLTELRLRPPEWYIPNKPSF